MCLVCLVIPKLFQARLHRWGLQLLNKDHCERYFHHYRIQPMHILEAFIRLFNRCCYWSVMMGVTFALLSFANAMASLANSDLLPRGSFLNAPWQNGSGTITTTSSTCGIHLLWLRSAPENLWSYLGSWRDPFAIRLPLAYLWCQFGLFNQAKPAARLEKIRKKPSEQSLGFLFFITSVFYAL